MVVRHEAIAGDMPDLLKALTQARLPIDDLSDPGRSFFRFSDDGTTIGFGGLELHGSDALLRSIVVLSDKRGHGYGRQVTETLLRHAFDNGARNAYLLTLSAAAFFEAAGFKPADRADVPPDILNTRQALTICSSAPLLMRSLEA